MSADWFRTLNCRPQPQQKNWIFFGRFLAPKHNADRTIKTINLSHRFFDEHLESISANVAFNACVLCYFFFYFRCLLLFVRQARRYFTLISIWLPLLNQSKHLHNHRSKQSKRDAKRRRQFSRPKWHYYLFSASHFCRRNVNGAQKNRSHTPCALAKQRNDVPISKTISLSTSFSLSLESRQLKWKQSKMQENYCAFFPLGSVGGSNVSAFGTGQRSKHPPASNLKCRKLSALWRINYEINLCL